MSDVIDAPTPLHSGSPISRPSAAVLAAVPVALGAVLALHPLMSFDPFALEGRLGRWFVVHFGLLFLLPALGGVAWMVLRGFAGPLALLGRAGILVFVALYSAYDALAGIGTGWLVRSALALDPAARDAVTPLITQWWTSLNPHWLASVASLAWGLFAVCAVVLHRRTGGHPAVLWGLSIGGLFALAHGSVPATATLLAFAAAVWVLHRPPGRLGAGSAAA